MKSIKLIAPVVLGIMSVALYSCSKSNDYTPPAIGDSSSVHKVNIQATQFNPANVTMVLGSTITWTNVDTDVHSIVSDDGTSYNSGNIAAGASVSLTPGANGTYNYHCGIHPTVTGVFYVVTR